MYIHNVSYGLFEQNTHRNYEVLNVSVHVSMDILSQTCLL